MNSKKQKRLLVCTEIITTHKRKIKRLAFINTKQKAKNLLFSTFIFVICMQISATGLGRLVIKCNFPSNTDKQSIQHAYGVFMVFGDFSLRAQLCKRVHNPELLTHYWYYTS